MKAGIIGAMEPEVAILKTKLVNGQHPRMLDTPFTKGS